LTAILRRKDRSLRGGKLVKEFTDYHALERVLSRISTAKPPEGTVKRLERFPSTLNRTDSQPL
jgi:hypothetical protein